jgi:hypothetical protein
MAVQWVLRSSEVRHQADNRVEMEQFTVVYL